MKPAEPIPVIVAKAKVKGAAQIEVQAIGDVQVRAKQPIHVKYLYRLEELSKDKENWRFRLASTIGRQTAAPTQANWDDRWGRNDSLWGVLQQEYVFDQPGTYEGTFEVDAQYSESEWGSQTVRSSVEKTAQGRFKIKVV